MRAWTRFLVKARGAARGALRLLRACGRDPRAALDETAAEELRNDFRSRYHQFKQLLSANNKALDIMSEMTAALKGTRPYGMKYVRQRCTRVSTDVFRIVKHLNELAPNKYAKLFDRYDDIVEKINPFIVARRREGTGPLAIALEKVDGSIAEQVGGKIANLGEVKNRIGLRVPNGFVITAHAYQRFMTYSDLQSEINRRIQSADLDKLSKRYTASTAIQKLIVSAAVPEDIRQAILEQYSQLEQIAGEGVAVAMRSSALGEDVMGTSFAGQYLSLLNVREDALLQGYKEIIASKYSLPAMLYRLNRGIRDDDVAMCVGVLRMVDATAGGVLYTRNPIDIRDDSVVIDAARGLPKTVVDGSVATDTFYVKRSDPPVFQSRIIRRQEWQFTNDLERGIGQMQPLGDEGRTATLTREQAVELARMGIALETHYGSPRDIEWAIGRDGCIRILQCRPLKRAEPILDAEEREIAGLGAGTAILEGGLAASPGIAAGPVCIVKRSKDVLRFPEGGVLVAERAFPQWAAVLNKAAAVVTARGSIAGHLANVAREFRVPALLGVDGALDVLRKGMTVTVDADLGRIYAGRNEDLLRYARKPINLMEGSAVYSAMRGAAEHITPLNLLDPNAISFRMENCRTLHDITRFCHEKAVTEMFRFGRDHCFPERSSKQLIEKVPMKWWVLNLDDGFKNEVDGDYIRLDNIVSIPMLALWKGITRFPWEGPPPVDTGGLMSVFFQATANTALLPSASSAYTDRNYFLISKNYCSLSSRLGFHFCISEALVGDRPRENYISFQFKGGAADFERRRKRIGFVADILEEHGFRVDIREDNLRARVEDLPKDEMEIHLRTIGYLSIHTRQLDMIMNDEAAIAYYRDKIQRDLKEMRAPLAT